MSVFSADRAESPGGLEGVGAGRDRLSALAGEHREGYLFGLWGQVGEGGEVVAVVVFPVFVLFVAVVVVVLFVFVVAVVVWVGGELGGFVEGREAAESGRDVRVQVFQFVFAGGSFGEGGEALEAVGEGSQVGSLGVVGCVGPSGRLGYGFSEPADDGAFHFGQVAYCDENAQGVPEPLSGGE